MSIWSRSRLAPSKHGAYFEVLSALGRDGYPPPASQPASDGCPICHLNRRGISRYLDALSYENVNDPGVRAILRAYRGFCSHHAWQFLEETRDGLGTAIIYRDVVSSLLRAMPVSKVASIGRSLALPAVGRREGHSHRPPEVSDALVERLSPQGSCPACTSLAESTWLYLDTLLVHLFDGEMQSRYLSSAGLCLPHLALAAARLPSRQGLDILATPYLDRFVRQNGESTAGRLGAPTSLTAALAGQPAAVWPEQHRRSGLPAEVVAESIRREAGRVRVEEGDGCPICQAASLAVDAWLADLPSLLEREPQWQELIAQARGLCNRHAWRLSQLAPLAAVGRVWRPVAALVGEKLRSAPSTQEEPGPKLWSVLALGRDSAARRQALALAEHLGPQTECPACQYQAAMEAAVTTRLLEGREERLAGLCLPHFLLALRLPAGAQRRASLVSRQAEVWQDLYADLDRYVYKHDYRFRDLPWGKEIDSPSRAVALVAGAKGVRGVRNS